MNSQLWVMAVLMSSLIVIVISIVKVKLHPFLALLLASFYVGVLMAMPPFEILSAIEAGMGSTLGFLAIVIGLGSILGKMMEISGASETIGLMLHKCRLLPPQIMIVLIGLICGITLFVEVGVVLFIPFAFSIAKKTNSSLLTIVIPLCSALMAVHCIVPPHPAALFVTNALGADIGSIIFYGLVVALLASLVSGPLFLKIIKNNIPFKSVPETFSQPNNKNENELPSLLPTLTIILLPIILMLIKTATELTIDKNSIFYAVFEFIGTPITAMLIGIFVAYYVLGIRQKMRMSDLLIKTECGFSSIANILLIIGAGGAFNGVLKSSGLSDGLAGILSQLNMHPILLAWLVAIILHAAVGSATVAMMGATAIVSPMLPLYPDISPEIITLAIGSGAIGCTIVTDSLFWLVKQYCGATLTEMFKYYTSSSFIASLVALGCTFLLSYIV